MKTHSLVCDFPRRWDWTLLRSLHSRIRLCITICLLCSLLVLAGCRERQEQPIEEPPTVSAPAEIRESASPVVQVSPRVTATPFPAEPEPASTAVAQETVRPVDPAQPSAPEPPTQSVRTTTLESTMPPLSRTRNVLVLGSDRRPNMPNWRTDVIMIVAMNMEKGQAGVISVPRDVYIDLIPGHLPNRINVLDYLGEQDEPDGGGPKLLAQVIEEKMGIPIHHYLRFDFDGFKEVVDALGGLEVTLDCPVSDFMPEEDIAIRLPAGSHRLDGRQALALVRTRRQGGDLERSRRQQRLVWAVREQIRRENLVTRVPALYAALHDSIQTDIGLVAAIRYVRFALTLDEEDVHGIVLAPPDMLREGWRGGMFVFVADWDLIAEQVQTIFDRPPLTETSTISSEPTEAVEVASPQAPRCP